MCASMIELLAYWDVYNTDDWATIYPIVPSIFRIEQCGGTGSVQRQPY